MSDALWMFWVFVVIPLVGFYLGRIGSSVSAEEKSHRPRKDEDNGRPGSNAT